MRALLELVRPAGFADREPKNFLDMGYNVDYYI